MNSTPAIEGGTPVRTAPLPYATQWIGDEERAAVDEVLRSDWLTTGPKVTEFEKAFAEYIGAPFAVAVSSCTAALHLAVEAIEPPSDAEAITTPLTFLATPLAARYAGITPKFADIEEDTLLLDPEAVERSITPNTRILMPVHYGGCPVNLDAFQSLCKTHDLSLVEDAAHATGSAYNGAPIGNHGDAVCFSLHAVKNMTSGEGGMLTTSDPELARRVRARRFFGVARDAYTRANDERPWVYEVNEYGFKYNMMDICAAIGLVQLRRLDDFNRRRAEIVSRYDAAFGGRDDLIRLRIPEDRQSSHHLYVVRVRLEALRVDRDRVLAALRAENVFANIHYIPVHLQPFFRKTYGCKEGDLPVAERVAKEIITLPLFPRMTDGDADSVIEALRRILDFYRR